MILCACGCGESLEKFDKYKRLRKYIKHHKKTAYWKGKKLPSHVVELMKLRRKGVKASEETKAKMRGRHTSKITEFRKGSRPWNKGTKGAMPSPWNKGLKGFRAGSVNNLWKGGKMKTYPEVVQIRKSVDYVAWRNAVYKRDNYTCQVCGIKGVKLEADHIKSFANYLDLRFELSNGRTLCKPCHRKTDTWGNKEYYKNYLNL